MAQFKQAIWQVLVLGVGLLLAQSVYSSGSRSIASIQQLRPETKASPASQIYKPASSQAESLLRSPQFYRRPASVSQKQSFLTLSPSHSQPTAPASSSAQETQSEGSVTILTVSPWSS